MAFKKIEGTKGQAISCDQKNKVVRGYLLDEVDVYRKKGKEVTVILHLQADEKEGKIIRVFAGYAMRDAVLNPDMTVKKVFSHKLVRFTWKEKVKLANKRTMNRIEIEVDTAKSAPKIKENVPF